MKYKENDTIENKNGTNRKVLGICGAVYCVSQEYHLDTFGGCFTESDLETMGFILNKRIKNTKN